MLCENCGKHPATTHIHTMVNGVSTEKNLCGYCAALLGYHKFGPSSISNLLSSMFGEIAETGTPPETKRCSVCGASFSDIVETGKVGCSACYETFYEQLLPSLKRLHGSIHHVGKTPEPTDLIVHKPDKLAELQQKLKELIEKENFEEAAVVRDQIKAFEEEGKEHE